MEKSKWDKGVKDSMYQKDGKKEGDDFETIDEKEKGSAVVKSAFAVEGEDEDEEGGEDMIINVDGDVVVASPIDVQAEQQNIRQEF